MPNYGRNLPTPVQIQKVEVPEAVIRSHTDITIDVKALMNVEAASYVAVFSLQQNGRKRLKKWIG